jgi:hypothetical protein
MPYRLTPAKIELKLLIISIIVTFYNHLLLFPFLMWCNSIAKMLVASTPLIIQLKSSAYIHYR